MDYFGYFLMENFRFLCRSNYNEFYCVGILCVCDPDVVTQDSLNRGN